MSAASQAPGLVSAAVDRYLQFCLYLMMLTGFGTLAATGQLDWLSVTVVMTALIIRGAMLIRGRQWLLPERWSQFLTLAYFAFYGIDFYFVSHSFITSTVHLVMFGLVVKLFSAQGTRDQLLLALLAFAMVLAASVLTVNSIFLLAFSAFLLMAVTTFMLLEMRRSAETAGVSIHHQTPTSEARLGRSLSGAAPLLLFAILAGAAGIFFVLPRISTGYLSAYSPTSDLSTGFGDSVQLGRIGEIQQSNAAVLHVHIDGDVSGAYLLKFRGVALTNFDGRNWTHPAGEFVLPRTADGSLVVVPPGVHVPNDGRHFQPAKPFHYRVLAEPLGSNVFFLPERPLLLRGEYNLVTMDADGAVYDRDRDRPLTRYEGTSDAALPEQNASVAVPLPANIAGRYLQLPDLDPRIAPLAEQAAGSGGNDYERARAIEQYLARTFPYTLQLPDHEPADPLAYFLFERKRGHCEYFASSMAVMLRTLNIPARIVNGFSGGEFNDITRQYIVRARDAHSWVEAYFPDRGWVTFDPTPADPYATGNGSWQRWRLYADALSSFWREWIVNYDASHQRALGEQATETSRRMVGQTQSVLEIRYQHWLRFARRSVDKLLSTRGWWMSGAVLLLALLLIVPAYRYFGGWQARRRLRLQAEDAPRQAAAVWYGRMTTTLARRGWPKAASQTPTEFAGTIPDVSVRAVVDRFTHHYERARFGVSPEDAQQLPELYEEIASSEKR